jgi:hypothetical protein
MKHFFLRDKNKTPVACVVSQRFNLQNGQDNIVFAVSAHNPLDRFNRREALVQAVLNFEKCGIILETHKGVKFTIMHTIAENQALFPQRARDAAKLWLKIQDEKAKRIEYEDQLEDQLIEEKVSVLQEYL